MPFDVVVLFQYTSLILYAVVVHGDVVVGQAQGMRSGDTAITIQRCRTGILRWGTLGGVDMQAIIPCRTAAGESHLAVRQGSKVRIIINIFEEIIAISRKCRRYVGVRSRMSLWEPALQSRNCQEMPSVDLRYLVHSSRRLCPCR